MHSQDQQRKMKRTRWVSTAVLVLAAVIVDLDSSVAFSPGASNSRADNNTERRRTRPKVTNEETRTGTDLNVAMSPFSPMNIYSSPLVTKSQPRTTKQPRRRPTEIVSLPSSSRAVSVGKRNRNSRMVRPMSWNSGPRLDGGRSAPADRDDLLTKDEERTLTLSIRSLRHSVRIRDELVGNSENLIPTEAEWAEACGLSVMGLRRAMVEGQQARTTLVSSNTGLVTSIAKRHYYSLKQATEAGGGVGTILTLADLIQEGNLGLMQAAERFETERGLRFSTYATYWIRQRILRSISDSSRIIRLPAHGKFSVFFSIHL
jgi:hypothetical protein